MNASFSGEQHHVQPSANEELRIGLEREILDPSTSLERLHEILNLVNDIESSSRVDGVKDFRVVSDEILNYLLLDGSTPLEDLRVIYSVIKEKRQTEALPPED